MKVARLIAGFVVVAFQVACATQQEEPETKSTLNGASSDASPDRVMQNLAPLQGVWIFASESRQGAFVCDGTMLVMRSTVAEKPELRLSCLDTVSNKPVGFPFEGVAGRTVYADVGGATGSIRAPTGVHDVLETYYARLQPGPVLVQTSIFPAGGHGHAQTVTTQTLRLEGGRLIYQYEIQGRTAPVTVVFERRP